MAWDAKGSKKASSTIVRRVHCETARSELDFIIHFSGDLQELSHVPFFYLPLDPFQDFILISKGLSWSGRSNGSYMESSMALRFLSFNCSLPLVFNFIIFNLLISISRLINACPYGYSTYLYFINISIRKELRIINNIILFLGELPVEPFLSSSSRLHG
jgi:hypothetical protein